MRKQIIRVLVGIILLSLSVLRKAGSDELKEEAVAVTTTLIESAVRELLGETTVIYRLMPPGSCPGHFDLTPEHVKRLLGARLFIRHHFQNALDQGLTRAGFTPSRIVSLSSHAALTIPTNFLAMCEELATHLTKAWPERELRIRSGLEAVRREAAKAVQDAAIGRRQLQGRKILCARYQKEFCEWMGLKVVADFQAGTDESAWQLARAVDMARTGGAEAVVGNLQWGSKHLTALTEALGLPGIMLSNFPESGETGAYWRLFASNLNALKKAFP